MKFPRHLFPFLLFVSLLASCEKADPYVDRLKGALERDSAPKQVVGLPDDEKLGVIPPPPEPVEMKPSVNKLARVSVLGYHDFTESRRPTQMIIRIDDFRGQMQAIADAKIPVISMRQFLDWKQGEGDIPPESIMITIDDGWEATHTLAMPVLREFGFPFTVFLYTNYLNVGGRSMSLEQVQELIEAGGTVCSHSVSHDFMNRQGGRTDEQYDEWLRAELNDSHQVLAGHFGSNVIKTFAYPYGAFNDRVLELTRDSGYEAGFTVVPGKVAWSDDDMLIKRQIIHGNLAKTFDAALDFGGGGSAAGRQLLTEQRDSETGEVEAPLVTVYPPAGSVVKNRLPRIEVNLSGLAGVQKESIAMRVSGLGKVPHRFDPETGIIAYQVPQRLRLENCSVQVSFRHDGKSKTETVGWNFTVDRTAEYLNADATFIRPEDEPVNPEEDLVLPDSDLAGETTETAAVPSDRLPQD